MTIEEYYLNWAKEYEESVNTLTEHIAQLREERKKAKLSELTALNERISILTGMKSDCKSIMETLIRRADHERRKAVQT